MNTTNAYHTAMQELAHDFDKLVNTFQKAMQDIQTKALSASEHKNRMSALTAHCREVMNGLKDEVSVSDHIQPIVSSIYLHMFADAKSTSLSLQKKSDRSGLNDAQLLLFQALMNN